MSKEIYYVRGFVCETTPTVVMVLAEDPASAFQSAIEAGLSGNTTIYPQGTFGGLNKGENLIIGFAS